ncbi:hypothetical protein GCK72_016944 [Caenorhabditis remanei]|uniref:Uncharacterized protein n=1 Tax=Caenorhabditis remanei TaxID=31234 RepID=A0A6A5G6W1_CAERE|nr:hypothetical protein GCK72_016944 [Caenorhabditis remanei]KAF1750395.1 hypothetical protein GCK72_016944 [Caenorhabditis remanei]
MLSLTHSFDSIILTLENELRKSLLALSTLIVTAARDLTLLKNRLEHPQEMIVAENWHQVLLGIPDRRVGESKWVLELGLLAHPAIRMIVLLANVVDETETLIAVQFVVLNVLQKIEIVSGLHMVEKRLSIVFTSVAKKADNAGLISVEVVFFPLTPFIVFLLLIRILERRHRVFKVLSEHIEPTFAKLQVVDDVELVVVVILRVHLTMVSLSHVIHESIAIREYLLAVNALVAVEFLLQMLDILGDEHQIIRRSQVEMMNHVQMVNDLRAISTSVVAAEDALNRLDSWENVVDALLSETLTPMFDIAFWIDNQVHLGDDDLVLLEKMLGESGDLLWEIEEFQTTDTHRRATPTWRVSNEWDSSR